MEEREIDLVDLMVEILYRWKGIVIAAVIGAVLMGGFSYYRNSKAAASVAYESMPAAQAKEYLDRSVKAADKFAARQVINSEKSLRYYEEYFGESVLINLDPSAVPQAVLVYSVDGKDLSETENITELYLHILKSGGLAQKLAENDGSISPAAAAELIRISGTYDPSSDTFASRAYGTMTGMPESVPAYEPVSFVVTLRNRTPEAVSRMADAAQEYIEGLSKDKAFSGKSHTCTLAARSEGTVMDPELMERQRDLWDRMYSYSSQNNNASSAKDNLTGGALAYYNVLKELEDQPDAGKEAQAAGETTDEINAADAAVNVSVAAPKASVSKKYVVIGFLAGAFVYAGIYLLMYLLDSRLHYTDDLGALYGISRIGSIPDEKKWGRSAYTRWLRKIRDRGNRFFPQDKAVELSCTSIRSLAEKKELTSLCLIGCNMEGQTGEICSSIVSSVAADGIQAESIANILYDADALKKFCGYRGVVLIEKAGETMYEEILKELQTITEQGLTLIGALVVE